jgi:hypothetical protein
MYTVYVWLVSNRNHILILYLPASSLYSKDVTVMWGIKYQSIFSCEWRSDSLIADHLAPSSYSEKISKSLISSTIVV